MKINLEQLRKPCICKRNHTLAVEEIVFKPDAVKEIPVFLKSAGYTKPVIICDTNTYPAAGKQIQQLIPGAAAIILNAENLHADEHGVAQVQENFDENTDLLLAVGAGTIHDITRYAAYQMQLPFYSIPTAASVDGFVSTVAAMTWKGFKKSFIAASPVAVFADSNIYAQAPARLTASGAADLLGKYTALADWKLGHLLLDEYLCPTICKLEEEALAVVVESLDGLKSGEQTACENLMYGLLLSGLAMQMVGNSRPASGAEHHLSHLWEMSLLNPPLDAYHGEKVGVGLAMACKHYKAAARQIRKGQYQLLIPNAPKNDIMELAGNNPAVAEDLLQENSPDPLEKISLSTLADKSTEILAILDSLPEAEEIKEYLSKVAAPVSLSQIDLPEALEADSIKYSPYIRNRLTGMRLLKFYQFQ